MWFTYPSGDASAARTMSVCPSSGEEEKLSPMMRTWFELEITATDRLEFSASEGISTRSRTSSKLPTICRERESPWSPPTLINVINKNISTNSSMKWWKCASHRHRIGIIAISRKLPISDLIIEAVFKARQRVMSQLLHVIKVDHMVCIGNNNQRLSIDVT